MKLKQVIVVPKDVKMSAGKLAAQVAHASVGAVLVTSRTHLVEKWRTEGMTKIVLEVPTTADLLKLEEDAFVRFDQIIFLVKDAGNTELASGTITALAIGPGNENDIDKLTGGLKLYSMRSEKND